MPTVAQVTRSLSRFPDGIGEKLMKAKPRVHATTADVLALAQDIVGHC
jgi:hypothetical protein